MGRSVVYFDLGNTLVYGSPNNSQPFDDAAETIAELWNRGYKIGLLSNQNPGTTHASVRTALDGYGFQSTLFEFMTLSSDFDPPIYKPDPRIFAAAAEKVGYPQASENLIFVTENLTHIETARTLGWRGIHKPFQAACTADSGECIENLHDLLVRLPEQGQQIQRLKIGSGSTTAGATNWQAYGNNTGIYIDIDTSACGFTATPGYFTSIGGNSSHWATTGATSIYYPTATKFRIYVRWANGSTLTPAQANNLNWHIHWIGIEGG